MAITVTANTITIRNSPKPPCRLVRIVGCGSLLSSIELLVCGGGGGGMFSKELVTRVE